MDSEALVDSVAPSQGTGRDWYRAARARFVLR